MKKFKSLICLFILYTPLLNGGIGCITASGSLGTLDYKEWRTVSYCTCDCENSHSILRGGICSGCRHRHLATPINVRRNFINMQTIVQMIDINQLSSSRRNTASKTE